MTPSISRDDYCPGVVESELVNTLTDSATQKMIADIHKVGLTPDAIARAMAYGIE